MGFNGWKMNDFDVFRPFREIELDYDSSVIHSVAHCHQESILPLCCNVRVLSAFMVHAVRKIDEIGLTFCVSVSIASNFTNRISLCIVPESKPIVDLREFTIVVFSFFSLVFQYVFIHFDW